MPQQFHLPRILGFLAAITCTCVTLAVAAQVTPATRDDAPGAPGKIILSVADAGDSSGQGQMPPVVFDHDLHTRGDENGETCARCHEPSARTFSPAAGKTEAEREDAYHAGCVSCHDAREDQDLRTGPMQTECRLCHNAAALSAAENAPAGADGGFDASLHARHIANPAISAPGDEKKCAACHHPVKNPVSPGLVADSCRSCHPDARRQQDADAPNSPLFADVAHKQCISCHQELPAAEKRALTCASCHDAQIKAGYAKLSPPPRLEAGQSDVVIMEPSRPAGEQIIPERPGEAKGDDAARDGGNPAGERTGIHSRRGEAESRPGWPGEANVVFDHKRHEATAENCVTCHHNTVQRCSTCHTPQGTPKGGNVSWPEAMHTPDSPRSCVGCHETRKTATPTCAGCHNAMPAKTRPDCASCHQPPAGAAPAPPDAPAEYAAAQNMLDERAKTSVPDLSQLPEKLALGSLSEQFEPARFPHRAIVEKLASGIRDDAPGMLWFHASPGALCASCHHNSPPPGASASSPGASAAPPSCVSCHAKNTAANASAPPDEPPPLKIAYHRQCMSCHTRMNVKPAATDCAGCHALRQKPHKTEGGR